MIGNDKLHELNVETEYWSSEVLRDAGESIKETAKIMRRESEQVLQDLNKQVQGTAQAMREYAEQNPYKRPH